MGGPGSADVAIVGAGHAGLCVAGALARRGITPIVFDDATRIGNTWRHRYDGLALNTERDASAIPGVSLPTSVGTWPTRDEWADHIERAAAVLGVTRIAERVRSVRRADEDHPSGERGGGEWSVHTVGGGVHRFRVVVVATGRNRVPNVPSWPGVETTTVEVIHAATFRSADRFAGRRVLVVGAGNSGTEIAHLLAHAGASVTISIRRRPVFLRRELFGTTITAAARLGKRLPDRVIDMSGRVMQHLLFGSLRPSGLGPPQHRLSEVAQASGATLDSGFVADVRAGRVSVTDAIVRFDGAEVVTRSGARHRPAVLIAATGYTPGLEGLMPPGSLDHDWPRARQPPFESLAGLYTAGLNPATLTAFHPDFIREAETIADHIARGHRGDRPADGAD